MRNYEDEQEKAKRHAIMGINRVNDRIQKKIREKLALERKLSKVNKETDKLEQELNQHVSIFKSTIIENSADILE